MNRLACLGLGLACVVAGCSQTTTIDVDAEIDAALDGGASDGGRDSGPSTPCTSSAACDDGLFCNGAEMCISGHCQAGTTTCTAGQTCDEAADTCVSSCGATEDLDRDGHRSRACAGGDDCDDNDPNRYPGNQEVCDPTAHDEDCDPTTYGFRDADADGEPDARCCNGTTCGSDCDDMRPTVHPGSTETCNGTDDDCDASIDEAVERTFFVDLDGDGFGDPNGATTMACFVPAGYSETSTDCNDADRDINPSHGEVCDAAMVDENCDGVANPPALCTCTGTDSRSCTAAGACSIAPVPETCNNVDDDCNGVVDDGLRVNCFVDADDDGYAASAAPMSSQCYAPTRPLVGGCPLGYTSIAPTAGATDCNDASRFVSPVGTEACNFVDDNCNGTIDESLTIVCYEDADNDTFPPSGPQIHDSCPTPGRALVGGCPPMQTNRLPMTGAIDCADNDPQRSPAAAELCNGIDDNCNMMTDEGVSATCYADGDGDTFAAMGATVSHLCGACGVGTTSRVPVAGAADCDDTRATVFPGAVDACDVAMLDEDCNGTPNDPPGGCACTGTTTRPCCAGRGTQTCSSGQWAPCSVASQPEVCNSMDDDCDGTIDNGVRATCYRDVDLDGYPASGAATMQACLPCSGNPGGWTDRAPTGANIDCADADPNIHPGAPEPCNGVDDDCDGMIDPGFCRIGTTCYANGVANPGNLDCEYCDAATPGVWSSRANGTACDDSNAATCTACMGGVCAPISGGNCMDSLTCTNDICSPGPSCSNSLAANRCLIGGVCYSSGALNPSNPCQSCQPSVSTSAFTNITNNLSCGCAGGVARICCNGNCVSAAAAPNCGSCGTTCSRGCFQGPDGATCGNACSRSTYRCCVGPVGAICECL